MTGEDDVIDISVLPLDRDPIDVLLRGDVPGDMADLAALFSLIRVVGEGPPPAPSPELADLIARGGRPAPPTARHLVPARRGAWARVAGVGIAMKLSLGVTAAAAGVAGAGMLPGATGSAVRRAIEVVTPIEMAPPTDDPSGDGAGRGAARDGGDGDGHDGRRVDGSTQGDRDGERDRDPDGDRSGNDPSQGDRDGRDGRTVGGWSEDDDHDDDTAGRGDDADDGPAPPDDRPEEPDDPPVRP